jgi:Tfp pilus assembly protein PilX
MNRTPSAVAASRGERGSAYLIALLALTVLTILGLALVLITQTEVQIGANERTLNRDFYAADAGASVPFQEFMVNSDPNTPAFDLNDVARGTGHVGDTTTPTPTPTVMVQCCNYCSCEEKATQRQVEVNLATTSTATRTAVDNSGATTFQGEKTVSILMSVWPIQESKINLLKTIQDPTKLQKVRW